MSTTCDWPDVHDLGKVVNINMENNMNYLYEYFIILSISLSLMLNSHFD